MDDRDHFQFVIQSFLNILISKYKSEKTDSYSLYLNDMEHSNIGILSNTYDIGIILTNIYLMKQLELYDFIINTIPINYNNLPNNINEIQYNMLYDKLKQNIPGLLQYVHIRQFKIMYDNNTEFINLIFSEGGFYKKLLKDITTYTLYDILRLINDISYIS